MLSSFNPKLKLQDTESTIKNKLIDLLSELKGFKFVTTYIYKLIRTLYRTFYSNSKAETIIDESNIEDVFESVFSTFITNIQKSSGQGSC